MALSSYAELSTAIGSWGTRVYTTVQTDEFILLAEAMFNRLLGSNFRRKVTATIDTDANGEGTLPTDFIGGLSIVRDVLGSVPLRQVSWDALVERNPFEISSDAAAYALRGTTIRLAGVTDDNYLAVYWGKLPALSATNTSNWLLTLAPDVYLAMCQAMARAFEEEFEQAAIYEAKAKGGLAELLAQANVAEYGNVEMTLSMVTP